MTMVNTKDPGNRHDRKQQLGTNSKHWTIGRAKNKCSLFSLQRNTTSNFRRDFHKCWCA